MVIVALIDDGFDLKHPDLSGEGRIVAPMDFTRHSHEPLPDRLTLTQKFRENGHDGREEHEQ